LIFGEFVISVGFSDYVKCVALTSLFSNGVYVFLKTFSANGQSYQGMDGGERKLWVILTFLSKT
jgi:hypothetical protein